MLDSVAETKLPDTIKAALCIDISHPRILLRGMTREHPLGKHPPHMIGYAVTICLRHSSRNTKHDHYEERGHLGFPNGKSNLN
jgi:hypothetical protein